MENKKAYQRKKQAQLDELIATIDLLKAKASHAGVDVQLKMEKHINLLGQKTEDAKEKLAVLKNADGDAWGSIKEGVDSVWVSLKSATDYVAAKFN